MANIVNELSVKIPDSEGVLGTGNGEGFTIRAEF